MYTWVTRTNPLLLNLLPVHSLQLLGALAWFWMIGPIVQSAWVLSRGFERALGPHVLLVAVRKCVVLSVIVAHSCLPPLRPPPPPREYECDHRVIGHYAIIPHYILHIIISPRPYFRPILSKIAICGGIIELLARLLVAGMTNASLWLAQDFNMNDWDDGDVMGTGWRVLEMIHIVTAGMLLWIDAFESLALFGIVSIMFYSVETEPNFSSRRRGNINASSSASPIVVVDDEDGSTPSPAGATIDAATGVTTSKVPIEPTFSSCFVTYGLFVGLLALLDFVCDILRFVDWALFGRMERVMTIALGCIFLPLWLLCLARELPRATERYECEGRRVGMLVNSIADDERTAFVRNDREVS
jgi:hypothetical protein